MLTAKQETLYWREWGAAHRAAPEADRHALHVEALGFDKSHKEFTNRDLDQVLAVFRARSRPADLSEQLRLEEGDRARQLHALGYVLDCLALYRGDLTPSDIAHILSLDEDPGGITDAGRRGAAAYAATVSSGKFLISPGGTLGPEDLRPGWVIERLGPEGSGVLVAKPRELMQLLMTLSARLNDMRNEAGETIHEMKTRAEVPCDCRRCKQAGKWRHVAAGVAQQAQAEAELVGDPF